MAEKFGGWQEKALHWLASQYDEAASAFSKEATGGLVQQVGANVIVVLSP